MNKKPAISLELLDRIENSIVPFSVAIWPSYTNTAQIPPWDRRLVASGSLIDLHGSQLLLSVGHFWMQLKKCMKSAAIDGICIGIEEKRHITLRFSELKESDLFLEVRDDILDDPTPKEGPDLLLVRIPREKAERARNAGKSFYKWDVKRLSIDYRKNVWTMIGHPVELAEGPHLSLVTVTGKLKGVLTTTNVHSYIDFLIDVEAAPYRGFAADPTPPRTLGGLSGSG